MYGKIVRHHSHVTGKIKWFKHSFYTQKIRENKSDFSLFPHNHFGLDFFFVMKGISLCGWRLKNLCIGGSNLTNVNYTNIGEQANFIDTIKFYQQSLGKVADFNRGGRGKNKVQIWKTLMKHRYFGELFDSLSERDNNWILN